MKKSLIIVFALLSILSTSTYGQCSSDGPNEGTIITNNTDVGVISWTDPTFIFTSDDQHAVAQAVVLGQVTNYAEVTGFGFSIPPSASICGITVEVEKRGTGVLQSITDSSVRLVKGGTVVGANRALASVWPSTDTNITYGGDSDLWGTTWTPSDINASDFGVVISANLLGASFLPSAEIDRVQISVDYNTPLPVDLKSFSASCNHNNGVIISWETSSETDNNYFTVEKSLNGFQWETVDVIPGAGNSNQVLAYYINDHTPLDKITYYRLKQTDINGEFQYFKINAVECFEHSPRIDIYPNPSQGNFTIKGLQAKTRIEIYDARGNLIYHKSNLSVKLDIELDGVRPGLYFVHFITGNEKVVEKIRINSGSK